MCFDEISDDGQSQTEAADLASCSCIGLTESVENIRQELRINTDTGVSNDEQQLRIILFESQFDLAVLWCELDGIGEEIPQNLLQTVGIASDEWCRLLYRNF